MREDRNYGIDLLRVISMFYVVMIHALAQGGILDNLNEGSRTSYLAWFMFAVGSSAVNIFGLITGYVSYSENEKPIRVAGYFRLWLQVVFYGLAVNIAFMILFGTTVTKDDFLRALFPIFYDEYWYFSAYIGLILLSPIINVGLRSISSSLAKKLFVTWIVGFSLYGLINHDPFRLGGGQTVLWLVILYCLGAIVKKCDIGSKINIYIAVTAEFMFALLTVVLKDFCENFIRYDVSITLLLQALLYIIIFSHLNFSGKATYAIKFFASSAFSVYLLNCHPFYFEFINSGRFSTLAKERAYVMAAGILSYAFIFVIASILIDKIRDLIFYILHIRQLTERLDKRIIT